jgi:hypothetical protein
MKSVLESFGQAFLSRKCATKIVMAKGFGESRQDFLVLGIQLGASQLWRPVRPEELAVLIN